MNGELPTINKININNLKELKHDSRKLHVKNKKKQPVFSGTNKKCQQCLEKCKQWAQIRIVYCSYFLSAQKNLPKKKRSEPLAMGEINST